MVTSAIAAAAMLALAGCQAPSGELRADTEPRPGAEAAAGAGERLAVAGRRRETAAVAPEKAERAALRPSIDSDPRRLVGLDRARLTALLGAPEFLRSDAPAELWRYRARHCMLDLFLYSREGGAAGALTVRHYTARTTKNGTIAAQRCLEALLRAREPGKPG